MEFAGGGDIIPRVVRLLVPEGACEDQSAGINIRRPAPVAEGDEIGEPDALSVPNISTWKLHGKALDAPGPLEKRGNGEGDRRAAATL